MGEIIGIREKPGNPGTLGLGILGIPAIQDRSGYQRTLVHQGREIIRLLLIDGYQTCPRVNLTGLIGIGHLIAPSLRGGWNLVYKIVISISHGIERP